MERIHYPLLDLAQAAVGSRWTSDSRTLTESELTLACMLSTDWHPVHADADYAANTTAGKRVFQGPYGVLLAVGIATRFPAVGTRDALALGLENWRFLAPLFIGDTVHVDVEVVEKRLTSDRRRTILKRIVKLVKNTGEVAQEGLASSMIFLSAEQGDTLPSPGDTA